MSKKTLNAQNLTALGAERLADLLMEVSTGSAEIKRRLRLELSHNVSPLELVRDVRKRLVSLRKSTSFVGWRKRRALIKDLTTQLEMITQKIAPEEPSEAFDLLWDFMDLAPSVFARVDDSRGEVGAVFRAALSGFEEIGPRAVLDPTALASRLWEAVRDDDYGTFDGIIARLSPTLGEGGLEHLKGLVAAYGETPVEVLSDEHAALQFLRDLRGDSGTFVQDHKERLVTLCLQEIAEAQGDTEAYIAQYSARDLARPDIAAEVAQLLLAKGQPEAALKAVNDADLTGGACDQRAWDAAYIACLCACDRLDAAQSHRWERFGATLEAGLLRDYLKELPDFEDIEAEDRALAAALDFENVHRALLFFLEWPDLSAAARLIVHRAAELDGALAHILTPAADALRTKHPLASVVLWRAMIDQVLAQGRAARYGAAIEAMMDCAAADGDILDYGPFEPHLGYVETVHARHKAKASFWDKLR